MEDEDTTIRRPLAYRPPLIFSAKYGEPIAEGNMTRFHGTEAGTYEVKASADGVKAYAFLWIFNDLALNGIEAIHHRQVCQILKKLLHIRREFGRVVLGGGYLLADYDRRILKVFGRSGDYGRVPDFMQFELFRRSPCSIHLAGYGNETAQPGVANIISATDWFLNHGIDVET
ncbi:hypothetical protein L0Y65_00210 [Candidatus Micrarchaeota archaeon]|nr:hypothetical protein [Candidatus Micrarchaeota archaeon]